jgi:transketolase
MTRSTISPPELDVLCINTLRFLAVEMVQKAKLGSSAARFNRSGHAIVDHGTYVVVSDGDLPVRGSARSLPGPGAAGGVSVLVIEADVTLGWDSYVGPPMAVLGVDRFGASAPGEVVMREYGFTVEDVCRRGRTVRDKKGVSEQ